MIDQIIAIGSSVVDSDGSELDSLCLKGYFKGKTMFEERTWSEFWSKPENADTLASLEYDGPYKDATYEEWIKMAIGEFVAFRAKWETKCEMEGKRLVTTSDNKVYDGGFINKCIGDYFPDMLPLPYTSSKTGNGGTIQEYKGMPETNSEQRGILAVVDPASFDSEGKYLNPHKSHGKHIARFFDVSAVRTEHEHDHNPAHDAYAIARDMQIVHGIRAGRIKRITQ